MKKFLSVILCLALTLTFTTVLVACHKHTFDEVNWEKDETYHWHPTLCEHSDVVEKIEHDINEFNKCVICGWQGELPYDSVDSDVWQSTFENFYNLRNFTITSTNYYSESYKVIEVTNTAIHYVCVDKEVNEEMYATVENGIATVCEFNDGVWSATSRTFDYDEWVEEQLEVFNVDDYSLKISESFEQFYFSEEEGGTYKYSVGTFVAFDQIYLRTFNARFVENSFCYFGREYAIAHFDFDSERTETDEVLLFVVLDKIGTTDLEINF